MYRSPIKNSMKIPQFVVKYWTGMRRIKVCQGHGRRKHSNKPGYVGSFRARTATGETLKNPKEKHSTYGHSGYLCCSLSSPENCWKVSFWLIRKNLSQVAPWACSNQHWCEIMLTQPDEYLLAISSITRRRPFRGFVSKVMWLGRPWKRWRLTR